ncbi:MAG: hypothetical protein OXE99_03410 [Cellvibrionales bacterium]|nr:hypothetical protein [Cellvibrionales bacterium]
MDNQPKSPSKGDAPLFEAAWQHRHIQARPFLLFCMIQHLMTVINPQSSWWDRLTHHLMNELPDLQGLGLDLNSMGVIQGFEHWDWQIHRQ